jgi:hypothetical protein
MFLSSADVRLTQESFWRSFCDLQNIFIKEDSGHKRMPLIGIGQTARNRKRYPPTTYISVRYCNSNVNSQNFKYLWSKRDYSVNCRRTYAIMHYFRDYSRGAPNGRRGLSGWNQSQNPQNWNLKKNRFCRNDNIKKFCVIYPSATNQPLEWPMTATYNPEK